MNFITAIIRKWTATSLVMRIFIGLLCGAFLGIVVPEWSGVAIFGQIFVSLLKAIAPVLVAVLVISSISKARGPLGPRFRVVVCQYVLSTFIAALTAVVVSFMFPVVLVLENVVEAQAPGALHDVFANQINNMVANPVSSISMPTTSVSCSGLLSLASH